MVTGIDGAADGDIQRLRGVAGEGDMVRPGAAEELRQFPAGVIDGTAGLQGGTVGNILLDSGYVSVSGSYERSREVDGEVYHHIFNTSDGYPVSNGLVSVAVIGDNGMEADALSTALFVLGLDGGYELYRSGKYDFEAIFITENREIYLTDGISEAFTLTADGYTVKNFED